MEKGRIGRVNMSEGSTGVFLFLVLVSGLSIEGEARSVLGEK